MASKLPKPGFQHLCRVRPQRDSALFPALPSEMHEGAGLEAHLRPLQRDDFRDACPAVVQRQQEGMVPPASYGLFPPHPVYGQVPSVGKQGVGQNGHGELAEPTKRVAVELYLSRLSPQELGVATGSSVAPFFVTMLALAAFGT